MINYNLHNPKQNNPKKNGDTITIEGVAIIIEAIAIFAAIIIFFTQQYIDYQNTLRALNATTEFNCRNANTIVKNQENYFELNEEGLRESPSMEYLIDNYSQNIGFFYKRFGDKVFENFLNAIHLMQNSNRNSDYLMQLTVLLTETEETSTFNRLITTRNATIKSLIENAEDIQSYICKENN